MLDCQDVFPKVLLEIGPIKVHFYGVMIAFSAIITYFLFKYFAHKYPKKLPKKISNDEIFDLIFWVVLGGIIGSRIFYVLVYNFAFFIKNPLEIFAVWHGGLSVHGGIIGGALTLYIFKKHKKWDFWQITDLAVPFLAMGLAFGRIANFVNGELIGRETDFIFGCDFGDGINRWPVQLIDSAKNFTIFAITIIIFAKTKLPKGFISGLFLFLIGFFRILTELIRQPDPQIGFLFDFLTMGQILASITAITGIAIMIHSFRKRAS